MIPTTIAPHGIIGASGLPRNASLDIDAYFPVDPERRWGVISTRQRRNGETIVEDLHWKIHGQREVNGKNAWLLGDEKKLTIMISKDEDGFLLFWTADGCCACVRSEHREGLYCLY